LIEGFCIPCHQEKVTLPSSIFWHARLGHLNFDDLRLLKKQGFSGLHTIPRNIAPYEACILGKHHKQPFLDSQWRASRKLELVHSYLCGPFSIPSAASNRYLMMIIDDYSKMSWVYFNISLKLFPSSKNFI